MEVKIFRRKIYNQLLDWKQNRSDSALLVEGARRIGKSFIVDKDGSFLANADKDETTSLNANIEINSSKSNIICSNFYDEIKKHY